MSLELFLAFFVAFLPQFTNPAQPLPLQFLLLGFTFLTLATLNAFLYAFFSGQLRELIDSPRILPWFNRLGGCALIGAGLYTAALKQPE